MPELEDLFDRESAWHSQASGMQPKVQSLTNSGSMVGIVHKPQLSEST